MAKCGMCGVEFRNKAHMAKHMLEEHESVFIDGDEALIAESEKLCKEGVAKDILDKAKSC